VSVFSPVSVFISTSLAPAPSINETVLLNQKPVAAALFRYPRYFGYFWYFY
jgi:hypothetical protein